MTNKQFIVIAVLLAVVAFGSFLGKQTSGVLGSYSPLQNTQPYGLYSNVTSTKLIATGAGNVAGIIVASNTSGAIKLWDYTSATSTVLLNTYTFSAGSSYINLYGARFTTGLYASTTGTVDADIIFNQ